MKRSILVVDDDDLIREMMDVTLTQAGFAVATASSGEAAMDLAKRMKFSVILLDIHMPRMSGLEVLKMLRKNGRPPIIMVTANRNAEAVNEAMRLGCAGYLCKPFKPDALIQRVKATLAARAAA